MTADDSPTGLRTEYASDPLGIDETNPCLRWRVETDRREARQTAFRVLVASTRERLDADEGDVWDTGKRTTTRPAVEYDGAPLTSEERYHWKVRVWDETGAASEWSDPATWEMGPLGTDDWEASWIRRPEDGEFERGRFSYFRREIALDAAVERARVHVSASHQCALSVNGSVVDRGQSFAYPDYQYYKTVDVTEALNAGGNALGVLHTWNGEGQGRPEAEPGLILRLVAELADGSRRVVVTDGSWRAREGPWVDAPLRNGEIAEPVEVVDQRRRPDGWSRPEFDDASWDAVEVLGEHPTDPWERLVAQNRRIERHAVVPDSVERLDTDALVFDFGRVYAGVPVVRFESGVDGRRVEMRAGYRRESDGSVSEDDGTQWTDMRYACVQRDGEQTFRPFHYLGFRYLQVDDPGEDLSLDQVKVVARHNEVPDPQAATFESSDETVDEVFELARHSALYGSQEQFVDTPTREKGQFLMDALNISRVTTRAFGERRLSRQAIEEFVQSHYRYWAESGRLNAVYPNGDGKRDIPDFTESFPEWVWRYYLVSDDRTVLETAYPVVRAVADYVVRHVDAETGLVTNLSGGEGGPYEEGIVDWPAEMRYGYDREWPARTTVNLLGVNTLRRAERIGAELGRPDPELAYFRRRREELESAVVDRLYDGDLFVDGCDAEGTSEHASQHANALALAFGVVPEKAVGRVADYVADVGMRMGPMMVPWLLQAFEASDRPAAMVDLLTNAEDDGWANILARGGTFTWETWHCRDGDLPDRERRNRSESHAMGATVLAYVQRVLLGVEFDDAAVGQFRIRPPTDGLRSATGRVPTEYGPLEVAWERTDGAFSISLTVPWNAEATVSLPVPAETTASVDGELLVTADGCTDADVAGVAGVDFDRTDGELAVDVTAGTFRFSVE
ncbi:alpha-L-rhamnosidase domain-containing protein [Halogeometricum pallidum JCM 14848]|uniref:alpha-L-rhamnosidase n=1 Tax=Halogeometricum pallidum JCM 14848 TaxID=1227487 RepID=M0CXX2_HALPD|nr:family 78 glycoside hydrolase catalytic domain [Halogeometricum pallidum]ELZ28050.1 alpha-L-rhamnosidase domain-containing protein [Halogeometricum pallidum JCM 14848]